MATVVEVSCEICGLSARLRPPDDVAFMDAHEEYHRSRGELPKATDAASVKPTPKTGTKVVVTFWSDGDWRTLLRLRRKIHRFLWWNRLRWLGTKWIPEDEPEEP